MSVVSIIRANARLIVAGALATAAAAGLRTIQEYPTRLFDLTKPNHGLAFVIAAALLSGSWARIGALAK